LHFGKSKLRLSLFAQAKWTDPQEPALVYSHLLFDFHFRRYTGFYLKNICLLVFIICYDLLQSLPCCRSLTSSALSLAIMSWAIFIIPPDILNDRLQVSITLFLALVAFNFVISEIIPKISYSTKLSQYFIANYTFLMLNGMESVVSFLIFKYYALSAALYLDWAAIAVFAITSSLYSLVFIYKGNKSSTTVQPLEKDEDTTIVRTGGGIEKYPDSDMWPVTATQKDDKVDVEKDKTV